MSRRSILVLISLAVSLLSIVAGLCLGSVSLSAADLLDLFRAPSESSLHSDILIHIRLPRVFAAYMTGALLAFSGCLMQALFQNILADSYLLGTASGASLGMLIAMITGLQGALLPLSAALGAWIVVLFVLAFAKAALDQGNRAMSSPTLLLIGVMITAIINAGVLLVLTLLPDHALRGALFWIIGDIAYPEYWPMATGMGLIALLSSMPFGQTLNILSYGPTQAKALGVPLLPAYWITILLVGAASGISVAIAGPVGFIGLMVPHLGRRLIGIDLRFLLPMSMAVGGALLVIADALARTVAAPTQLPIGIFTTLIGAPTLLWLLYRRRKPS